MRRCRQCGHISQPTTSCDRDLCDEYRTGRRHYHCGHEDQHGGCTTAGCQTDRVTLNEIGAGGTMSDLQLIEWLTDGTALATIDGALVRLTIETIDREYVKRRIDASKRFFADDAVEWAPAMPHRKETLDDDDRELVTRLEDVLGPGSVDDLTRGWDRP